MESLGQIPPKYSWVPVLFIIGLLPAELSWVKVLFVIIYTALFILNYLFNVIKNGADAFKYVHDTFQSIEKK